MRVDAGASQGREERSPLPSRRSWEDRRDMDLMTQTAQPSPQHLYHALETAEFGGRDDVQDHHVRDPTGLVSNRLQPALARRPAPSTDTTAAAKPHPWLTLA